MVFKGMTRLAAPHFVDWPADGSATKSASIDNPNMLKRIGKMTGSMVLKSLIKV